MPAAQYFFLSIKQETPILGSLFDIYRPILLLAFFAGTTASTLCLTSSSITFHFSHSIMCIILSQMVRPSWMMSSYHLYPFAAMRNRRKIPFSGSNVSFPAAHYPSNRARLRQTAIVSAGMAGSFSASKKCAVRAPASEPVYIIMSFCVRSTYFYAISYYTK